MLKTSEVAKKLNVSDRTVLTLIKRGEIHAIRIGTRYRVTQQDLDAYLERQKMVENLF